MMLAVFGDANSPMPTGECENRKERPLIEIDGQKGEQNEADRGDEHPSGRKRTSSVAIR